MEHALFRLQQAIKHLRDIGKSHNQQDMADRLGMGKANFSRAINGAPRYLTEGFLNRFADAYSEYLNKEWLVKGNGTMIKADTRNTRPHIPMQVAAGFTGVAITTVPESDVEHRPRIDYLPTYDFTIGVEGDSMEPMLQPDDVLACRRIDSSRDIKQKAIYVIETTDGAVVKQIIHVAKSGLTAHSLNPKYDDFIILLPTVISISQVVGLIRPNPQLAL